MTKKGLAEAAEITVRSVSAYEAGSTVPTDETIARLAAALAFPPEFFDGDEVDLLAADGASFRSLSSMTASQRDSALAAGALAVMLSEWVHERFELPPANVPDLRGHEPEAAAGALRTAWGLGERPIRNVVQLLEANGVRVFSLVQESADVDAFSVWRSDVPFVFLNTMKSAERSRFDAAHELGHLVLHRHGAPQGREAEREADAFASAFLMPAGSVHARAPGFATLDALVKLKRVWNVSVAALAHRLHRLGLVSEWHYRTLCIQMSERGFRREEPDGIARETSQLLQKVFAALRAERITPGDVARELRITQRELDTLVFGLVLLPVAGRAHSSGRAPREGPRLRLVE